MKKFKINRDVTMTVMIIFSALVNATALKSFASQGNLFPGGFSGISRILIEIFDKFANIQIPFGLLYVLLNLPVTLLVFKYVGKRFTIYSILQYGLVSLFVEILPPILITDDLLLIAVFGGMIAGFGIGLALRSNASSGGMDFIAIYFSNRFNMPIWNYVMGINVAVLALAGILFGWERSLYSIIYQFASTQVVNRMHERYKLESLIVITEFPDEVSESIFHTCRHGITKLWGEGAYSHRPKCMLYITINAYQLNDVVMAIKEVDAKAFVSVQRTEKIIGNYYQKPLD